MKMIMRSCREILQNTQDLLDFAGLVKEKICSPAETFVPIFRSRKVRKHDNFRWLMSPLDVFEKLHTAAFRHPHVYDRHVGFQCLHQTERLDCVFRLGHDLYAVNLGEQFRESYPYDCRVIYDKYFHDCRASSRSIVCK